MEMPLCRSASSRNEHECCNGASKFCSTMVYNSHRHYFVRYAQDWTQTPPTLQYSSQRISLCNKLYC